MVIVAIYPLSLSATPKSKQNDVINPAASGCDLLVQQPSDSNEQDQTEFGTVGLKRWYVQGGGAITVDSDDNDGQHFGLLGIGLSHFFANGHSINFELNSMAFNQAEKDALGLNLSVLMRWHFYQQPNWSLYFDGGAGILGTTNNVPNDGGTSLNFTPQLGLGGTIPITDKRRLRVGVRWHHISNAESYDTNPGRDSIMGYMGLNFNY